MDKKFENLVLNIMKECAEDGEPVTREEAEEMAKMEMKEKTMNRVVISDEKKRPTKKPRKVDTEKKHLFDCIKVLLEGMNATIDSTKTETEINFTYNGCSYGLKLSKHRPKK